MHIIKKNKNNWRSLGVSSVIIKALLEQNFDSPTTIQALTLPSAILGHKDILGAAETGSGKTLAFGIPILQGIIELKKMKNCIAKTASGQFKIRSVNDDNTSSSESESDNLTIKKPKNSSFIKNKKLELNQILNDDMIEPTHPLYAVILTPTRELAIQIKDHLSKAAKYTDIKVSI